jgi:hypothetical protein
VADEEGFQGENDEKFVSADAPLRQGDVLQLLASKDADDWSAHFGVLVTADCDLAHGKSGGVVTYVPAVPVEVYVQAFILPAEAERHADRADRALAETLERHELSISRARILEMLALGETPDAIVALARLDGPSRPDAHRAISRIQACNFARAALESQPSFEDSVQALVSLRAAINDLAPNPSKKPASQLVRSDISSRLNTLRNDAMFVSRLSPNHTHGCVAYLRLLREMPISLIALSPAHERLDPTISFRARRIARLRLLYVHKLLQQMAAVFTDIGLPTDYEAERDRFFTQVVQSWCPDIPNTEGQA